MGRRILVLAINPGLDLSPAFFPDATLNNAYSVTLTAFSGQEPYTLSHVSGTLPTGLSFTDNGDGTATIAGTPTVPGSAVLRIRIRDHNREVRERDYSLRVVALPLGLSLTLPDATVGEAYAGSASASGGVEPYTYTKVAGPSWMSVNSSTGAITGTPTSAETGAVVTVQVEDSDGTTAQLSDTMNIAYDPVVVSGTFNDSIIGQPFSGALSISGGSESYSSVQVVSGTAPTGASFAIDGATVTISGTADETEMEYTFTLRVTDSAGNTDDHEVTLEVYHPIVRWFADGGLGHWWHVEPEYCFSDSTGTTPANVGDVVKYITDRSGNGCYLSDPGAGNPTLRMDATLGRHYLEFSGAESLWSGAALPAAGQFKWMHDGTEWASVALAQFGTAANPNTGYVLYSTNNGATATAGTLALYDDRSSVSRNDQWRLLIDRASSGTVTVDMGTANGALAANTPTVVSTTFAYGITGDDASVRVDQGATVTTAESANAPSSADEHAFFRIGMASSGALPLTGRIYALALLRGAGAIDLTPDAELAV